jgi:soluble lytic murein transglycosylase-like protein
VWELADRYSARYGLDDPRVLRALILAESEGNPRAVKRTESEWSVGLLQANRLGGRGEGHSEADLLDPERNLALGMPEIAAAYRQAVADGYRGAPLAVRVAELAQRPDPDTLYRFAAAYETLE